MKKLLLIAIAVMFIMGGTAPLFASLSNLEYMDEMDLLYKVKADDFILYTEYVDIGVESGIWNLGNPFNDKPVSSYIGGVVSIKKVRIVNRLWSWVTNR